MHKSLLNILSFTRYNLPQVERIYTQYFSAEWTIPREKIEKLAQPSILHPENFTQAEIQKIKSISKHENEQVSEMSSESSSETVKQLERALVLLGRRDCF